MKANEAPEKIYLYPSSIKEGKILGRWFKTRYNQDSIEYTRTDTFIGSMQKQPATSVWHDANNLPSDPSAVIVEHNEYSMSICRAEQMSRVKGAKWAYIDDLLKL